MSGMNLKTNEKFKACAHGWTNTTHDINFKDADIYIYRFLC